MHGNMIVCSNMWCDMMGFPSRMIVLAAMSVCRRIKFDILDALRKSAREARLSAAYLRRPFRMRY